MFKNSRAASARITCLRRDSISSSVVSIVRKRFAIPLAAHVRTSSPLAHTSVSSLLLHRAQQAKIQQTTINMHIAFEIRCFEFITISTMRDTINL